MRTYGQFCPVARTSELLAERWTPIIIRNLLTGCRTFTDIRQGAPGIPPALLTKRLATLERHGIIERERGPSGRGWSYRLTEQGQDLKAVCDAMGQWGARWLEIEPRHMDPAYALWATTKLVDRGQLPDRTVVVRFELRDLPAVELLAPAAQATPGVVHQGNRVRRGHRRPHRCGLPDRHPPEADQLPRGTAQRPSGPGRAAPSSPAPS